MLRHPLPPPLNIDCSHKILYILQMDRLQSALQEREMTGSQLEMHFKSKISDKEEESARLKAEINILHEKLSQSSSQVW